MSLEINQKEKQPMSEIEQAITDMLQENTGASFLDSGGAYGRNWERNQQVQDFRDQPAVRVDYFNNEVSIGLNVFHFLTSTLTVTEKSKELNKAFQEFANSPQFEHSSYSEIIEEFSNLGYLKQYGLKASGGENTYNHDSMLSQVLQYHLLSETNTRYGSEYPDFIILQIHGGCDVRGGYTAPQIFEFADFDNFILFQHNLDAACKCTSIYSDDQGYNWYINEQPEPTLLDKMLGVGDRTEDFEDSDFPQYWEIQEDQERIYCKCCKNSVEISSGVEYC